MEALLPFLALGIIIWVILAATRRSPNTSVPPRSTTPVRSSSPEQPFVIVQKPASKPKATPSAFQTPVATVNQQESAPPIQPSSPPQKHISLFQGRDEIVKAVIYHEIFTPKFKR